MSQVSLYLSLRLRVDVPIYPKCFLDSAAKYRNRQIGADVVLKV